MLVRHTRKVALLPEVRDESKAKSTQKPSRYLKSRYRPYKLNLEA